MSFLLAAFCFGCQPKDSPNIADYHDPALRHQLTQMVSDLHTDRAVPKVINDLDAILSVNSSRLGLDQKANLTLALGKLRGMRSNLAEFTATQNNKLESEYQTLFLEAKQLLTKAAATF